MKRVAVTVEAEDDFLWADLLDHVALLVANRDIRIMPLPDPVDQPLSARWAGQIAIAVQDVSVPGPRFFVAAHDGEGVVRVVSPGYLTSEAAHRYLARYSEAEQTRQGLTVISYTQS